MSAALSRLSLDLLSLERIYADGVLPRDVLTEVLSRVAAHPDPAVWIDLLPAAEVLARADAVAEQRRGGRFLPLYGVPFAIKDNIDVAGRPTTAACPAFRRIPRETASVVTRLLAAGGILVGKTNLDQFATGLAGDRSPHGACRNVFDPKYISGSSSSGSAVAVAAGLVSFAGNGYGGFGPRAGRVQQHRRPQANARTARRRWRRSRLPFARLRLGLRPDGR